MTTIHDAEAGDVLAVGDRTIGSYSFVADETMPHTWTSSDKTLVLTVSDGDLRIRRVGGGEVVVKNYRTGLLELNGVRFEPGSDDSGDSGDSGSGSGGGSGSGHVNHAPELQEPLLDAECRAGEAFLHELPEDAFIDLDNDPLTYAATLADGSDLPSWPAFAPETRTFAGAPEEAGTWNVVVTTRW